MFGKGTAHGWEGLREDILTFADLIGFTPRTHEQEHMLLRVQNNTDRLGMVSDVQTMFPIFATAMLWRAFAWQIPSVCLVERFSSGEWWINVMHHWLKTADVAVQQNVKVSTARRFLKVSDTTHVCHVIGPFNHGEDNYQPGQQDVMVLDFDEMPIERFNDALDLADGAILYLPIIDGSLVQHQHRQNDADGAGGDSQAGS